MSSLRIYSVSFQCAMLKLHLQLSPRVDVVFRFVQRRFAERGEHNSLPYAVHLGSSSSVFGRGLELFAKQCSETDRSRLSRSLVTAHSCRQLSFVLERSFSRRCFTVSATANCFCAPSLQICLAAAARGTVTWSVKSYSWSSWQMRRLTRRFGGTTLPRERGREHTSVKVGEETC